MDTLQVVEVGTQVLAKELVGKKGFNILHDTTFVDNVHSVKWFNATKTAVVINYNDNQTVTVPANEVYVYVKEGVISYEDMAHNVLGRNWKEKYNYTEDNSAYASYHKKIKTLIRDNAGKILFHECNNAWGHIDSDVRRALGIYRGVKTVKDFSISELARIYVTAQRELFRLVEPE